MQSVDTVALTNNTRTQKFEAGRLCVCGPHNVYSEDVTE